MKAIFIFSLILLSACSSPGPKKFSSNDHSNEVWGLQTRILLFEDDGVEIYSSLKRIISTFDNGYRTDKESWLISVLNNNEYPICLNITLLVDNFQYISLKNTDNLIVNPQTYTDIANLHQIAEQSPILGFNFYDTSTAILGAKLKDISKCK